MPSEQDLIHGIDFTGLSNPVTAAEHNTLVDNAVPGLDCGLNLKTDDSALDTPDVPDVTLVPKWKKYLWIRRPHATATSTVPIVYAWDENAVSDPTLLKWQVVTADITELQDQVNELDIIAHQAFDRATAAQGTANLAVGNAQAAKDAATIASQDASDSASLAATAQASAQASQDAVDEAVDWTNRYAKYSESFASGTAAVPLAVDTGAIGPKHATRIINTVDSDIHNLFSLAALTGKLTCLIAGKYKISVKCVVAEGGNGSIYHQAVVVRDDDVIINSLVGNNTRNFGNGVMLESSICGVITLAVNDVIKVVSYLNTAFAACDNGSPGSFGTREVYTTIELMKLDPEA